MSISTCKKHPSSLGTKRTAFWPSHWRLHAASILFLACWLWGGSHSPLLAQTTLVKNINPSGSSSPAGFTVLGTNLYFRANDGTNGIELWKTDGTADGTVMVKDINPSGNSSPAGFTVLGTNLYFQTTDGINGIELWKTDGTADGTVLVKDINTGSGNSSPAGFTVLGTNLYFQATDGINGIELWKTDGTADGTVLVKDINTGSGSSSPTGFTVLGTNLYFQATDGITGTELWKTDGTADGTVMVKNINPGGNSSPASFRVMGTNLYFSANDGTNGLELWKTDGTADGTVLVKDINTGSNHSSPGGFRVMGTNLYFQAADATNGMELWKTDGTADGTVLVKDINTGSGHSSPAGLTLLGTNLYFRGIDATNGGELWKTDGTADGTVLVKDINTGSGHSSPANFTLLGTNVYFQATDGINGTEPWKTDGTADGTVMVKDINPSGNSSPTGFTLLGTNVYFQADDGTNGIELWKYSPATPTITTTASLTAFTTCEGTASAQQSFTVSGSNLTSDITVTAPTGFQVSTTSGSSFGPSVTLTQSSGSVGNTIIYVRMAASSSSPSNGNVTCASTGATTKNVAASGTVNALPSITITGSSSICPLATTNVSPTSGGTWTSSNNGVATVTNAGVVTGVAEGTATFTFTQTSTGCSNTTTSTVYVNALPLVYNVTGTGSYCSGGTGVAVGLSNSEGGVWYQLKNGSTNVGDEVIGTTGSAVNFGNQMAGTYTVVARRASGSCTASMTGSAVVSINPLPTITLGTPTNPTTCGGTDGKIAFNYGSGTIPDGTYSMSYSLGGNTLTKYVTFGNPLPRISAEATAIQTAFLTGLGAGSYSSFQITINGCTVIPTGITPVGLSNPTAPTFTVGTPTKPSTCVATDGSLPLTGLANSTSYSVSYQKDGAAAVVQTLSSNASGAITIPNLGAGAYTNITVTLSGCTSAAGSATVSNPSYALAISTPTNPTTCGGTDGKIAFTYGSGTIPDGTYSMSYSLGGSTLSKNVRFGSAVTRISAEGEGLTAFLEGLGAGSYSNFQITINGCTVIPTGTTPVELSAPATPTFSVGTPITPTTCGGTNGSIPLTGLMATTNYSVSYQKDGAAATVSPLTTNASGGLTIGSLGAGNYTNITVTLGSCTSTAASVTLANPPSATASISGTTTVCQNAPNPLVTFTGANGTAPYTFSYRINGGAVQTLTTSGSSISATLAQNTTAAGVVNYSLVAVNDAQGCGQNQSGTATVTVQGKPTITLNTLQQTFNEGNNPVLCDTDANPLNGLQFTVSEACVSGNPVWRVQVGNGAWSTWNTNAPSSQPSDNQTYRYQAACDANCPNSFTNPISITVNYRASTPLNVSLTADGVTVNAGETKDVCNVEGNAISFNATCAQGEMLLYSVDGGDYTSVLPTQQIDGQYHNYRLRCRNANGTPSCLETESAAMRLKISAIPTAPTASLNVNSGCGTPANFSGTATCPAGFTTVWFNASTNVALPNLPATTPNQTTSYYARCQNEAGCQSEKSNTVTFTLVPVNEAPTVSVSSELVCAGTEVTVSTSCPAGATVLWNTGVTDNSFKVAFSNITTQNYSARCIFENGCQSPFSAPKSVRWKAFELTIINIGQSKSAVKTNDRAAWANQFVTPDGGPSLDNSTQQNPTLYFTENANKTGPRYWTVNVDACALGTSGSLTFDMLVTPETGVVRSYNTHENNAPYFMYANREGWTELYAQNHPAYGFYEDNGTGGNVYDTGLPKGLYKLGVRYWDMKGWGSIFPSTRKPQGNVLAYQEYWFRIQSKDGVGTGAARLGAEGNLSSRRDLNPLIFAEVMPNPVSSVLRLKVADAKDQKVTVNLMDASGRQVVSRSFVPDTNTHQEEFNVSELPTGMYFLKVKADDKQATLKVVKVQ